MRFSARAFRRTDVHVRGIEKAKRRRLVLRSSYTAAFLREVRRCRRKRDRAEKISRSLAGQNPGRCSPATGVK